MARTLSQFEFYFLSIDKHIAQQPATADSVVATYDVYLTPALVSSLYILQYPARDRDRPFNAAHGTEPLEMRIKSTSGFLEMDVPIPEESYDQEKGQNWGEAVMDANADGLTGFGLANGLAASNTGSASFRGAGKRRRRSGPVGDVDGRGNEGEESNHESRNKLARQTYGGQIMRDEAGKPFYMIGAFRGHELHLTKVDGIVQMRPQFHYIDAKSQVERDSARKDRESAEGLRSLEPRYVPMHARSVDNDNEREVDTTKEFLQNAQDESWTQLRYYDEDAEEAYEAYNENALVHNTTDAPKLTSSMTNEEYVDAISAPRLDAQGRVRKKPVTRRQRSTVEISEESDASDHPDATNGA